MLVLMTLTHMPTQFSSPLGQPFGYVSAAEGFVFLSAFIAGQVYSRKALRQGVPAMRQAFWQRARKLYFCQLGLLLLAFTLFAWLGIRNHQGGMTGLVEFYLLKPVTAVVGSVLLVYTPPLLDILPIYIVFMAVSPWVLARGLRRGWGPVLALSGLIWLAEQWGAAHWLYQAVNRWVPMPIPYRDMGAFHVLAWQFLWVLGLALGARQAPLPRIPAWVWVPAAVFAMVSLVWRHRVGQDPMPGVPLMTWLFDKWALGPLRMVNFACLLALLLAAGPWLKARLPRPLPLELLGQHSLSVFCLHLIIAMLTLAYFGSTEVLRPWTTDLVILLGAFAGLFATALVSQARDERRLPWQRPSASKVR